MDFTSIIHEIGGGLSAVVIVVLGAANYVQYKRNNELQDKMQEIMLTMGKENRDLLTVTTSAVNSNTSLMRETLDRLGRQ